MNEFTNTNYSHDIAKNPIGIYYIHREQKIGSKKEYRGMLHFYFVRVKGRKGITTVARCETKADAEKIFLEHTPYWEGQIPYYEIGGRLLRKFPNRK